MQNLVAVISADTVVRNAECLSRAAKKPFYAVVKDDAYGHGAERIALALQEKAGAFAVSTAEEGVSLRTAGVTKDILVLTPPLDREDAAHIRAYGLIASLSSPPVLGLLAREKGIRAHLAVNTGMNRYGVLPHEAGEYFSLALRKGISMEGVYSHLYDGSDPLARAEQTRLFSEAVKRVRAVFPAAISHLSATGGALAGDGADFVRLGIGLYGYLPAGARRVPVRPAMKLYARVSQSGEFAGGGVGYARAEKEYSHLYTLRLGYGDGFFRSGDGESIGNLCMDASIREGNPPFGGWRRVLRDVTAYARAHGTTEYEVLVNVTKRAVRVYV